MGTPYLAEIRIISWNYAPKGWAFCNGQFLPINQNQALFSLLGTTYGGNGTTTFQLPNLQGRVPIHFGNGFTQGQVGGETAHTLLLTEMPSHNHFLNADAATASSSSVATASNTTVLGQSVGKQTPSGSFAVAMYSTASAGGQLAPQVIGNNGGSQPHENEQPYTVMNYIIALQGIFPSRN